MDPVPSETLNADSQKDEPQGPCMHDITLIKGQGHVFRAPTATLPEEYLAGLRDNKNKATMKNRNVDINVPFSKSLENIEIDPNHASSATTSSTSITKIESVQKPTTSENQADYITLQLNIHQAYHKFIIGRGGAQLSKIQRETSARVQIPQGKDIVSIKGTQQATQAARASIEQIVKSHTQKLPPTHFLSLPLIDPHLAKKVAAFQSDILSLSLPNLGESTICKVPSLHLTLGVLPLYKKEDIEGAVKLLNSLSEEICDLIGTSAFVHVKGLAVMGNDPAKTRVLHAQIQEPEGQSVLKKLIDFLNDNFKKAGYIKQEDRPIIIHATIMKSRRSGITFSAESILKKYADIDFGTCRLQNLQLCMMGKFDVEDRYQYVCSIKLP